MYNKAIAYFQEQQCKSTTTAAEMQYYSKAIFALGKREPRLVNHDKTFWHYYHYCPDCCTQLQIECQHFCPQCGQALDWSNYKEGLKRGR
jgi:hypothetical protein